MNIKEELRKISIGKQINRNTMQRTEHIAFDEDTLIKFIEKLVGQIEPPVMPKIADKTGKRTYEKATIDEIKRTLNRIDYLLYNVNFNDTDRVCFAKIAILELDSFGKSS